MKKNASWKANPEDRAFRAVREKIILSAVELIIETGVAGLRLDAVARHAGLARSSLYRYFDNKDQLVFELLEYEFELVMRRIREDTAQIENVAEKLIENAYRSVEACRSDPTMVRLVGNGDEKTVSLIAFALREVPRRRAPLMAEWGLFANEPPAVAERKSENLVHWLLCVVYSMVVFGNGRLDREQERQMFSDMLKPVLTGLLPVPDAAATIIGQS